MVREHNVTFIGGDFNMALFTAKGTLDARGVQSTFLGSYAWRQLSEATCCGGESVPVQGFEGVRFDSLGLFAVGPVSSVIRAITPQITPLQGEFSTHLKDKGQGYAAASYVPDMDEEGIKRVFAPAPAFISSEAGEQVTSVCIKQKMTKFNIFIEDDKGKRETLLSKGAHMPLLFFWGSESRRSPVARQNRQERAKNHGWGVNSWNRTQDMQRRQAASEQHQQAAAGIPRDGAKGWAKAAGGGQARRHPAQTRWQSGGGWQGSEGEAWNESVGGWSWR